MIRCIVWVLTVLLCVAPCAVAQSGRAPLNAASTFSLGSEPTLTNMKIWLRADTLARGMVDGQAVPSWPDWSGTGNSAVCGASCPTIRIGLGSIAGFNGQPFVHFIGAVPQWFNLPAGAFSGLVAGEVFAVIKNANDPPPNDSGSGLWNLGLDNANPFPSTHHPFTTNVTYESFGSTTRKDLTAGFNPNFVNTHIWNVWTGNGVNMYAVNYNATTVFTEAGTNTVGWPTAATGGPRIGTSSVPGYAFSGDIAEFIFYDTILSAVDRTIVTAYLRDKYNISGVGLLTTPYKQDCDLVLLNTPRDQGQLAVRECGTSNEQGFVWPVQWLPNMPTTGTVRLEIEVQPAVDNYICQANDSPFICCDSLVNGTCGNVTLSAAIGCAHTGSVPATRTTWGTETAVNASINGFPGMVIYTMVPFPTLALPSNIGADRMCFVRVRRNPPAVFDVSPGDISIRGGRLIF